MSRRSFCLRLLTWEGGVFRRETPPLRTGIINCILVYNLYIYPEKHVSDMQKHVTIKDIALELGISKSTVSRALADRFDVKPETRKAVLEMAEKLKYRPNVMALNFMHQQTKIIGVVVPEFLNSFFPRMIIEIQRVCEQSGYNVLITQSNENPADERKNLEVMLNAMVDGLIVSVVHRSRNMDIFKQLQEEGIPVVFVNRPSDLPNATQVIVDDEKMSFFAVEHLIYKSRRRILHLTGPAELKNTQERLTGYRNALVKHGIPVEKHFLREGGIDRESGYYAMRQSLAEEPVPDAVYAFNDPVAMGAMKAIKEAGYRIPQDIAVVGFSESRSALLVDPPLTSVEQPLSELGATSARLLLERIENPETPFKTVVLNARLNVRRSSDEDAGGLDA